MKIKIADLTFLINFTGSTEPVEKVYQYIFREFIVDSDSSIGQVHGQVAVREHHGILFEEEPLLDKALGPDDLKAWFPDKQFNKNTIGAGFLNGVLLFSPEVNFEKADTQDINADLTPDNKMYRGEVLLGDSKINRLRPLYRLLWAFFAMCLGEQGGCFLHAGAVAKDEKAYLFLGDSGAGKSTITSQCQGGEVLSDEAPVLKAGRVYSSPFHQLDQELEVKNTKADIAGFYFIIRDLKNQITQLEKPEAAFKIITKYIHFFYILTIKARTELFDIVMKECNNNDSYIFSFKKDTDIFQIIEKGA